MRQLPKALRILAAICVFGVVAVALLLAALWADHRRPTALPAPTGPYPVGRIAFDWRDTSQQELLAPRPGIPREILAWVWYPASSQPPARPVEYFPAAWRDAFNQQRGWFLTQFLWSDLSAVHANAAYAPAFAPGQQKFPVIVMRAGLAAETLAYSSLAEDLASHGYVVVGFDAPYRSTVVVESDGNVLARTSQNNADLLSGSQQRQLATRLMHAWSSDTGFALDRLRALNGGDPAGRFTGKLDLEKVGIFGHSLGGATALQFCHVDARCRAVVDLDGAPLGSVVAEGLHQPFLLLVSDHSHEPAKDTAPVEEALRSIVAHSPPDHGLWISLRSAGHFGFADQRPLPLQAVQALGISSGGQWQTAITRDSLRNFFDVHLKGAPASRLRSVDRYPQVQFLPLPH